VLVDHGVEGLEPLAGLDLVDVRVLGRDAVGDDRLVVGVATEASWWADRRRATGLEGGSAPDRRGCSTVTAGAGPRRGPLGYRCLHASGRGGADPDWRCWPPVPVPARTCAARSSDGVEQLRGETGGAQRRARFCLAVTRVATAIESGSPATAQEAAEELLAQAPDDLAADTQAVVTELRRVLADDEADLRDAELRAAIDRLSARTLELCDPS
jgi:hypothetical protein